MSVPMPRATTSHEGANADLVAQAQEVEDERERVEKANQQRASRRGYLVFATDPSRAPDEPGYREVFVTEAKTPAEAMAKVRPLAEGHRLRTFLATGTYKDELVNARWVGALTQAATVTNMASNPVDTRDRNTADVLYELAEGQAGYLTAQQAVTAGIPRSTLGYHAGEGETLERVGSGIYRLRRFPTSPHGHIVAGWLGLAPADAVVSHVSALELLELSDLIADQVHVTLPRAKRGLRIPDGVRAHFTTRPIDRSQRTRVLGVPVTSVERTLADQLRAAGWTEQIDLAIQQAIRRGLTTRARLQTAIPKTWQRRLAAALDEA